MENKASKRSFEAADWPESPLVIGRWICYWIHSAGWLLVGVEAPAIRPVTVAAVRAIRAAEVVAIRLGRKQAADRKWRGVGSRRPG